MNVKFKMPKFGRNLTGKGWFKELMMTFLGTTISIILTFGTAQYLENRHTEQTRRMMAMTIINDIDQSIDVVKKRMEAEVMKPRLVKKLDQNNRTAQATNIDKSGTRLELTDDEKKTIHYQKKVN